MSYDEESIEILKYSTFRAPSLGQYFQLRCLIALEQSLYVPSGLKVIL